MPDWEALGTKEHLLLTISKYNSYHMLKKGHHCVLSQFVSKEIRGEWATNKLALFLLLIITLQLPLPSPTLNIPASKAKTNLYSNRSCEEFRNQEAGKKRVAKLCGRPLPLQDLKYVLFFCYWTMERNAKHELHFITTGTTEMNKMSIFKQF